jgi:hypothetical protein
MSQKKKLYLATDGKSDDSVGCARHCKAFRCIAARSRNECMQGGGVCGWRDDQGCTCDGHDDLRIMLLSGRQGAPVSIIAVRPLRPESLPFTENATLVSQKPTLLTLSTVTSVLWSTVFCVQKGRLNIPYKR